VDLFLVAPATANILAKFANGIADDFLSSTYLASTAPVLVAPAMNTTMWNHAATQRNLQQLKADGVRIVEPDSGEMACRTIGPGRLSEPERIVAVALEILQASQVHNTQDLKGERLLITAGATREEIDPVRFLSNHSSGRMGFAIAEAARARGADVTVVAGETRARVPDNIQIIRALSAEQMQTEVMKELGSATIFVGAAAVADYRPAIRVESKIKKSDSPFSLSLEPIPDILRGVANSRRNGLLVVGFAAETENLIANARAKLESKQLDLIVANDITREGAGFDVDTNIITMLRRDDATATELQLMSKLDAAHAILDEIVLLRQGLSR
jgi:phosphopantothenoylcysteine decarboxylase/phosphopantothenate--cysteine ligase